MATVGLTFKRVFNEAHNHLQNTVLPLGITSTSGHPSSLSMPSQSATTFRDELKEFLEHVKHVVLIPLSWWLTIWHFIMSLTWAFLDLYKSLPLKISIAFYENEVRKRFPFLPSILGTLALLFPGGIKLPTLTSLTAGPYKGEGPTGSDLPTLDNSALLNSIINGDAGINGVHDADESAQNGNELESALKKIPTSSPGDLDGALADVKVWARYKSTRGS
ncbi:hypothetical protein BJV77DRAFT_1081220 [Russula vinacea]|nr:hypothetical protein BJV77DRAFT_1081220 [Russula vinacea]